MHTSEFRSKRIYSCLAHTTKQAPACPHFEALQIAFATAFPDPSELPQEAWPEFMVQMDNDARRTGSHVGFLQDHSRFQNMR